MRVIKLTDSDGYTQRGKPGETCWLPLGTRPPRLDGTKLCQAGYMSAERRMTIDLTDPAIQKELETYTPLIAQGKGAEVLM